MGKYFLIRILLISNCGGALIDNMEFIVGILKKLSYFRSHHQGDSFGYLN
jgi:hypothetical protein